MQNVMGILPVQHVRRVTTVPIAMQGEPVEYVNQLR